MADIALAEVQAALIQRGAPVGIGTVHRFFARHGITRKKDWTCNGFVLVT